VVVSSLRVRHPAPTIERDSQPKTQTPLPKNTTRCWLYRCDANPLRCERRVFPIPDQHHPRPQNPIFHIPVFVQAPRGPRQPGGNHQPAAEQVGGPASAGSGRAASEHRAKGISARVPVFNFTVNPTLEPAWPAPSRAKLHPLWQCCAVHTL